MLKSVLLMVSSKSFMISGFILMSLIQFEFILVYDKGGNVQSYSFTCGCLVFPAPVFEDIFLLSIVYLCLFIIYIDHKCVGLCGALYSVPLIYASVSVTVPCLFHYCSFIVQAEIREHDTSSFVLFSFKNDLEIWSLSWFHMSFRINDFVSVKIS